MLPSLIAHHLQAGPSSACWLLHAVISADFCRGKAKQELKDQSFMLWTPLLAFCCPIMPLVHLKVSRNDSFPWKSWITKDEQQWGSSTTQQGFILICLMISHHNPQCPDILRNTDYCLSVWKLHLSSRNRQHIPVFFRFYLNVTGHRTQQLLDEVLPKDYTKWAAYSGDCSKLQPPVISASLFILLCFCCCVCCSILHTLKSLFLATINICF